MSTDGAQAHVAAPTPPAVPTLEPPNFSPTIAEQTALRHAWRRLDTLILFVAILCGLSLYVFRLGQPNQYIYDELYHAYTAARLAEGNPDPYNPFSKVPEADRRENKVAYVWDHPAFAKLPMQVGIKLFGDEPFGWRIANAVFGALGIGIFFALGRVMFDREIALYATGLLLLDGLWFVESRLALNDIYLVCFLLLGYLAFFLYLRSPLDRRWRFLWLTGAGLGMAIATKWSALYSIGLIGLIAGLREAWLALRGLRGAPLRSLGLGLGALATLLAALVALPAALYVGAYAQYFSMGFSWADWRELQRQMWWYHTHLEACHNWASPWWSWPLMLRPVWYHLFIMGNPLSWWLYLPAIIFVAVQWIRGRFASVALGVVLLGFLGQWLPWSLSPRVSYFYHMLPSVPFGCLALAYGLRQIRRHDLRIAGRRLARGRTIVAVYGAIVLLSFGFFYSMFTWLPVSDATILPLSRISASLPDLNWTQMHYWLPTWPPASSWAFGCPQPSIFAEIRALLPW